MFGKTLLALVTVVTFFITLLFVGSVRQITVAIRRSAFECT